MKKLVAFFFLIYSINATAQVNLVPNPSFEVFDTCPDAPSQITRAIPWFQPYLPQSSRDFLMRVLLVFLLLYPLKFARSDEALSDLFNEFRIITVR
jgi:hypothetical protein